MRYKALVLLFLVGTLGACKKQPQCSTEVAEGTIIGFSGADSVLIGEMIPIGIEVSTANLCVGTVDAFFNGIDDSVIVIDTRIKHSGPVTESECPCVGQTSIAAKVYFSSRRRGHFYFLPSTSLGPGIVHMVTVY